MTHRRDCDVLVIGEALIDIVQTDADRIEHVGGSPANVALGLGRRGADVALLTYLADDSRGDAIIRHMEQSGVHVLVESISAGHTPTAIATIGADGQAEYEFDVAWALRRPAGLAQRLVHTGSVATFLEPGASAVRDLLRGTPATEITYDPNIRPALLSCHDEALSVFEDTARLATVVKMSDEDAAWLYPGVAPDLVLDAVLELGPRLGAMTLGSKGAIIVNADHRVWVPAAAVSVVDTIGAGDTFMASLINSLLISGSEDLSREMLEHIGRDAVAAAAITVSRKGADLPWAAEL